MTQLGSLRLDAELAAAIENAAAALSDAGAQVQRRVVPHLDKGFEIWAGTLENTSAQSYEQILGQGTGVSHLWELLSMPFGRSAHTLPAVIVSAAEKISERLPSVLKRYAALAPPLQTHLEKLLGTTGVLLYPVYPRSAPKHHHALLRPRLTAH